MSVIKAKIQDELNRQINCEFEAAYTYFSMALYCESRSLDGMGQWMRIQANEEVQHGLKICKYMQDLGCEVKLEDVKITQDNYKSLAEVFEKALENETDLAERFNRLSAIALEEQDNITYNFLKWFLEEQVEEIALVSEVLDKVKMANEEGNALLILNEELGKRIPEQVEM